MRKMVLESNKLFVESDQELLQTLIIFEDGTVEFVGLSGGNDTRFFNVTREVKMSLKKEDVSKLFEEALEYLEEDGSMIYYGKGHWYFEYYDQQGLVKEVEGSLDGFKDDQGHNPNNRGTKIFKRTFKWDGSIKSKNGGNVMDYQELLNNIKNEFPDKAIDIIESLELLKMLIDDTVETIGEKVNESFLEKQYDKLPYYSKLAEEMGTYEKKLKEVIDILDIEDLELEDKKEEDEEKEALEFNLKNNNEIKSRMKAFKTMLERKEVLKEFDRYVFESIVEKVIVGEIDENGKVDPYKLTFVYKTGFKDGLNGERFKTPRKNASAKNKRIGRNSAELPSYVSNHVNKLSSHSSDDTRGMCD